MSLPPWATLPRQAVSRLALTVGIVTLNLVLVLTIGISGPERDVSAAGQRSEAVRTTASHPPQPYAEVPPAAPAAPDDRPRASDQATLRRWSESVSNRTGLALRAVTAYGKAEMWMRYEHPECHLSWATLAAISSLATKPAPGEVTDAALALARSLCAPDVDMRAPTGWWTAVVGHKPSVAYARKVFDAAERYALAAR